MTRRGAGDEEAVIRRQRAHADRQPRVFVLDAVRLVDHHVPVLSLFIYFVLFFGYYLFLFLVLDAVGLVDHHVPFFFVFSFFRFFDRHVPVF